MCSPSSELRRRPEPRAQMGTNRTPGCTPVRMAPAARRGRAWEPPQKKAMSAMRRSIIVGVDSSREATEAARVGASLARRLDRNLVLARVVAEPPASPYGSRLPSAALRRRAIQSATDLLKAVATEIGEAGARKRVALVRARRTRGLMMVLPAWCVRRTPICLWSDPMRRGALPVGSGQAVSASLLRSSPCPVIVVPAGATNRFAGRRSAAGPGHLRHRLVGVIRSRARRRRGPRRPARTCGVADLR